LVNSVGNVVGIVVARLPDFAALQISQMLPQNVNYAMKCDSVTTFLESIPELSVKLRAPYSAKERRFEDVVKEVQEATALVVAY